MDALELDVRPWAISGPRDLGFESRYSDHKMKTAHLGGLHFFSFIGIRKDGTSPKTGAKKCPADTFLVRGRIHYSIDAPLAGVDME